MVLVTHEPRVAQATTRLLSLQNGLMVPPQALESSR